MLTVNHRANGVDTIYQTTVATYIGPNAAYGPGGLSIDHPDPQSEANKLLQDGEAFVMNDAGATIAKYVLPQRPSVACGKIGGVASPALPTDR